MHEPLPNPYPTLFYHIHREQFCRDPSLPLSFLNASIRQCSSLFFFGNTQLDPAFCRSSDRVVIGEACDFETRRRIQSRYGTIRAARVFVTVLVTRCCLGGVRGTEHYLAHYSFRCVLSVHVLTSVSNMSGQPALLVASYHEINLRAPNPT